LAGGLTLRTVGEAIGMSASLLSRIERGQLPGVSLEELAAGGAAVGLDVRFNAYPGPDPVRDAASLALEARFRPRLAATVTMRTEVPLPEARDLRAWDGYLEGLTGIRSTMPAEFETRIEDLQAQQRRLWLKARDANEPYVLLVVADTRRNRDAIRAAGASLTDTFPVPARQALAALGRGQHPGGSALLFV
jgi:transcriptional regulator with XRE-family HTH domain